MSIYIHVGIKLSVFACFGVIFVTLFIVSERTACNNEICSHYLLSSQFGMKSTCCNFVECVVYTDNSRMIDGSKKIISCVIFVFSFWKKKYMSSTYSCLDILDKFIVTHY